MTTAARWWTAAETATERERETAADKRRYVEDGLTPVTCTCCGTQVRVRKNSERHTSIQWSAGATCPEIAGTNGVPHLGCPRLKESIAAAVASGALAVTDG